MVGASGGRGGTPLPDWRQDWAGAARIWHRGVTQGQGLTLKVGVSVLEEPVLGREGRGTLQGMRGKPDETSSVSGLTPASEGDKRGRRDTKWRSEGRAVCCGPKAELEVTKLPATEGEAAGPGRWQANQPWSPHPGVVRLFTGARAARGVEAEERDISPRQTPRPTMMSLRLESTVPHHGQFRGASPSSEHLMSEGPELWTHPGCGTFGGVQLQPPRRRGRPTPVTAALGGILLGVRSEPHGPIYILGALVRSRRGWDRTGLARAGLQKRVWALPSLVRACGQDPQAPLPFPGGLPDQESPEQPFEALQKERLSLTPNVRQPWGGPRVGRGAPALDAWVTTRVSALSMGS